MEHAVVSQAEWLEARKAHLQHEKELTKLRDRLLEERRALPWVKIETEYVFESANGPITLSELFDGRSQLIIQHFMLGPGWDEGCPGCSFGADHITGALVHLENHDVSYVAVSRAPLAEIERYHARMSWPFPWVSSNGNSFNYDFNVSFTPEQLAAGPVLYNYREEKLQGGEQPGWSVFYKNENGEIFHTYSTYGRGNEEIASTLMLLDMTPLGRNDGPAGNMSGWVRRHDDYDHPLVSHAPQREAVPAVSGGSCGCGCEH